jgi:hypothetical protein
LTYKDSQEAGDFRLFDTKTTRVQTTQTLCVPDTAAKKLFCNSAVGVQYMGSFLTVKLALDQPNKYAFVERDAANLMDITFTQNSIVRFVSCYSI